MSDIREREWIESLIESAVDESSREIAESALRAHTVSYTHLRAHET